jgi:hypothetical protein
MSKSVLWSGHGCAGPRVMALSVIVSCCLMLWAATSCLHAGGGGPMRPHLHECTRLEIEFLPSAAKYFLSPQDLQNLLNSAEREVLVSFTKVVCEDQESIKAFADDLRSGCYWGSWEGQPAMRNRVRITYYQDAQRVGSFTIFDTDVKTEDGHTFRYGGGFPHFDLLMPEVIRPLLLRGACAGKLYRLYGAFLSEKGVPSYPNPEEWSDAVLRQARLHDLDRSYTRSPFECPSVKRSDYAMNEKCTPDSRGQTVLLFETQAGWNQHGGPELFGFDNHDPKGGCVLLKDGTVKFVRTEKELKQLRWK